MGYTMWHETPRNRPATGAASPTGHPAAKGRHESVGRGPCRECVRKLRVPMVSGIPKEGIAGTPPSTNPRPSAQALHIAEEATGDVALEGLPVGGVSDRSVDLKARRRDDPPAFRRGLPSLPCLETPGKPGVELPEAGAPGPATGRSRDRPLEALPMAAYKKTHKNVEPIWSSWMNPASCSSPTWPAPGLPKEKHRSCTISTNKTESRRLVLWRCLPNESDWPSIFICAPTISQGSMSERSCNTCSAIFGGRWSCCGIGERSIAAGRSNTGSPRIQGSTWKRSRPTPRNSIRRSMFGTRPTAPWRIVHPRTCSSSTGGSETRCDEFVDRNHFFGPASTLPICHGQGDAFHYLCKYQ